MTNNLMIFTIFCYIICILTITLSDALAGDPLLYNNRKPTIENQLIILLIMKAKF